jgi:hypothetical protein
LKVEKASEATSKLGNSTNLKNNSKLADSNMYLKHHYKNYLCENLKLACHNKKINHQKQMSKAALTVTAILHSE